MDTFNNNETGVAFFVAPTGIRLDFSIFNDAQGNLPANVSWNTFWRAEAVQNDEGWFAEMRIPFSSLRYSIEDDEVKMGLIVQRWMPRKNESLLFPAIPNNWGWFGQYKPSQAQKIKFEGLENQNPLQIKPYLMGGLQQNHQLNDAGSTFFRDDQFTYDAGLDFKYGINSNLTLDVTLNTDFAQVEADNQQVNLTRYSLFFPEKRKFFQERSSLFDFRLEGSSRLFYSRRIGISQGEEIPILGGLRLTGSSGEWDVGILDMQTARSGNIPTENFGVMRMKRTLFNNNSYAGGMLTSRLDENGNYNIAYGLDGVFQIRNSNYLSYSISQTQYKDATTKIFSLDPTYLRLLLEARKNEGFGYNLDYSRSGKYFNPGIGFSPRDNFTRFGNNIFYGWFADEDSKILNYKLAIDGWYFLRNEDSSTESGYLGPRLDINMKPGASISIGAGLNYQDLKRDFGVFRGVIIPRGSYQYYDINAYYGSTVSNDVYYDISLNIGEFYDGFRWTASIGPSWSISPNLDISGFYQINHLKFADREDNYTVHLGRFGLDYYFSKELAVSTLTQYSNAAKQITSNFRLRYNPKEGNDLYVVYNEGLNTDRYSYAPTRPLSNRRTILVKYTYTFNY